jgi:predicted transcriptional regulator YdeE
MIANFPEIKVVCVRSKMGIKGSKEAFDTLESKLSDLKKRKFYGLVSGIYPNEEYRACVAIESDDEARLLGFETYTIPAGRYVQERVKNWSENILLIGEAFENFLVNISKTFLAIVSNSIEALGTC